ncbi:hypothetical protein [Paenibacillus tyrfis]|uniref:hypothetical protein n=1 Tax=Paenibacillus tyrfis TaxID=1501230 RepID=UPI00209DB5D0|nr:hypothetical protein [Paenibacillus tyrfis]MCP1306115.1 hypothetical protein [Paenibacillus tyrfis]
MKVKKVLLTSVASAVLVFSIMGSAFAETLQKPSLQTNELAPVSLQTTTKHNSKYSSDVEKLKSHGVSDETIQRLGGDVDVLASQIDHLSKTQIANFTNGLIKSAETSVKMKNLLSAGQNDNSTQYVAKVINGEVTLENGNKIPVPNSHKLDSSSGAHTSGYNINEGPMYNVDAKLGYSKVSALVTLPQVKSTYKSGVIPYVLNGIFMSNGQGGYTGGADLGLFYEDNQWRLCINGGNGLWVNSKDPINTSNVFIIFKVSAWDTVEIAAYDGQSYHPITSIYYWMGGKNFDPSGNGVEMATGFSLALKYYHGLNDGSYLRGGRFQNTYLYNNNETRLWTSDLTTHRDKKRTDDEKRCIYVNTNSYDYDYSVDINLNLP